MLHKLTHKTQHMKLAQHVMLFIWCDQTVRLTTRWKYCC